MKKSELIDAVAEKAQTSKAAAARAVEAIFDTGSGAIAEAIRAGRDVSIPGFGKFRRRERAARKGRNPRTGKEIDIPAGSVVAFTPGRGLKDSLSSSRGNSRKKATSGAASTQKSKSTAQKAKSGGSRGGSKR